MQISVNGKNMDLSKMKSYSSITITNDGIIADGVNISGSFNQSNYGHDIHVEIYGDVKDLNVHGSANVRGNVKGDLDCHGGCSIDGSVQGNVDVHGNLSSGDIFGNVNARGNVHCSSKSHEDYDFGW